MVINKPKPIIVHLSFKYLDWNTGEEFDISELDQHTEWYKEWYDKRGNCVHTIYSDETWDWSEFNELDQEIYFEASEGWWEKYEYDLSGNKIREINNQGGWTKWEYDDAGNLISSEDSDGTIRNYR